MRLSIYLGKDKAWLIDILTARVAGGRLTGRKTSMGQELLHLAEQNILKDLYEAQNAISKRTSDPDQAGPDEHGG